MDEEAKQRASKKGEKFAEVLLAPNPNFIDWRLPNWLTFIFFGLVLAALQIDPKQVYFSYMSGTFVAALTASFFGQAIRWITNVYVAQIVEFEPKTTLDAKRANEQIKSLATAINGIAAAGAMAVAVKQLTQIDPDYTLIVIATGLAFWVHTGARSLLGRLKDEQAS